MVLNYTYIVLIRVLVPMVLGISALIRPVGISFVYLLMFFISPFISLKSSMKKKGASTFAYCIILITLCILIVSCHIVIQFIPQVAKGGFIESLCRHIGFITFANLRVLAAIEWIVPEVAVLIVSFLAVFFTKKLTAEINQSFQPDTFETGGRSIPIQFYYPNLDFFHSIAPFFSMVCLCLTAILKPSAIGGLYFVIFIGFGTYWACYNSLKRGFGIALRCLLVLFVFQIIFIITYQIPWPQQNLSNDTLIARLLALEPLIVPSCGEDIRFICYNSNLDIDSFLVPVVILITYYVLALTSNLILHKKVVSEANPNAAPRKSIAVNKKVEQSNFMEQFWYGISSTGGFIYQNSYIFTNVLMMTWSIVYHSWLTFVLLIWANVLWMIPNQRKAMMRSSFFIVMYAEALLIAQYLFGMNLKNGELPSSLHKSGINLEQIGFQRFEKPSIPLMVKTMFTLMFWVTLRQTRKEISDRKIMSTQQSYLDVQMTKPKKETSKVLKKAGDIIKKTLVNLWIWLLIIVIFTCATTGKKMTVFRICYMALFLFFLLIFQISFKIWLKIMYGFWLVIIFYAMTMLTLIYTYQFDKFNEYWEMYLGISTDLQEDLGLKKFETKELFLQLVSPTLIVILTVIQVHYFHKKLIASIQSTSIRVGFSEPTSAEQLFELLTIEIIPDDKKSVFYEIKVNLKKLLKFLKAKCIQSAKPTKELIWLILELHLMKLIYFVAFLACATEVCLLHTSLVILTIFGCLANSRIKFFISRLISFIVSIIVLTKMIYQFGYLQHSNYDIQCENINSTESVQNNAEWFGLQKTSENSSLIQLIKIYIIYMIIVTINEVVNIRQRKNRFSRGKMMNKIPTVLFANITRKDAEVDLNGLIKFIANYGFYKFGVEFTLIVMVATISIRQDIIAIPYTIWLYILMVLYRYQRQIVWPFLLWFCAISIILQFIIILGLPPIVCLNGIWENSQYSDGLQAWALLSGNSNYRHQLKLIPEFILLMCICCQRQVFVLEQDDNYPGGSNKSILKWFEGLGSKFHENITYDFITNVRNWLDIFKTILLRGFYWLTLAIVFLAGTHTSDIFAIGYLVGSFVFLWQGTEFYLRPIQQIVSRWNFLVFYNVATITIKTMLQLPGCLFKEILEGQACWLVHLLELSCYQKFKNMGGDNKDNGECPAIESSSVLVWDALCFSCLIFQLRIFKSQYFWHVINDTKANTILASRGAELIADLRKKQIEHRLKYEKLVLRKIKKKMEKIRSTQQKTLAMIGYKNPRHGDGTEEIPPTVDDDLSGLSTGYHTPAENNDGTDKDMSCDLSSINDIDDDYILVPLRANSMKRKLILLRSKRRYSNISFGGDNIPVSSPSKRPYSWGPITNVCLDSFSSEISQTTVHGESVRAGDYYMFEDMDEKIDFDLFEQTDDYFSEIEDKFKKSRTSLGKLEGTTPKLIPQEKDSTDILNTRKSVRTPVKFMDQSIDEEKQSKEIELEDKTSTDHEKIDEQTKMDGDEIEQTDQSIDEEKQSEEIELEDKTSTDHEKIDEQIKIDGDEIEQIDEQGKPIKLERPDDHGEPDENDKQKKPDEFDELDETEKSDALSDGSANRIAIFLTGILEQLTSTIYALSKHYRYVTRVLGEEKKALKMSKEFEKSIRYGSSQMWTPFLRLRKSKDSVIIEEQEEEQFTSQDHHIIVQLLIAVWYAFLANTDIVCYMVVFLYQVVNASVISLPLPFVVFLWGTLSLPRPTKTFWVTLIAYTECLVFIKCIFQYKLIWSNYVNLPNQPLSAAKLIGVELRQHYANFDLVLLLFLFFHRFILKSQGLWTSEIKDTNEEQNVVIPETSGEEIHPISEGDDSEDIIDERQNSFDDNLPPTYLKKLSKMSSMKYFSSLNFFFRDLVNRTRLPVDVYAIMFLCDFVNFFVLLFGFAAFGSYHSDGGVSTYLSENKVPLSFLIMLLVQFILIVIDRALYLRKALVLKIIFHFLSVIGIHLWMFFVIPAITERSFYSSTPPVIFYIIKCVYLLLSSFQIKCGYPKRILGNFVTKGFNLLNMISFKIYMYIPFLYEIRTILDWICTDSTMTVFDWLKMEGIFAEIFFIKCSRKLEQDYPAMRGLKKPFYIKFLMGGSIVAIIVIVIWGPLCIFALGNAVGIANIPTAARVTIQIASYEPLFDAEIRETIHPFKYHNLISLQNIYGKNREALTFLSSYDESDIATVEFPNHSPSFWTISPPDRNNLFDDLKSNSTLVLQFTYQITRAPSHKNANPTVSSALKYIMKSEDKNAMISILQGNLNESVLLKIPNIVPKFIKIGSTDDITVISHFLENGLAYRPLYLKLSSEPKFRENDVGINWWYVREDCSDSVHNKYLSHWPNSNCEHGLVMYTFNDKKFPSTFSILTGGGIIGIYTTFVLVASRVMKSFTSGLCRQIMFQDLPYVDRILQLCMDIYLVREALEFTLEEDLFAKLIFLYRSPETMIKWTRPKEEESVTSTES